MIPGWLGSFLRALGGLDPWFCGFELGCWVWKWVESGEDEERGWDGTGASDVVRVRLGEGTRDVGDLWWLSVFGICEEVVMTALHVWIEMKRFEVPVLIGIYCMSELVERV